MTTESTTRPAGTEGLNGYIGFYDGKRHEFYAATLFEAKTKAVEHFKPPKKRAHMVSVYLAERSDGSAVKHVADF